MHTMLASPLSLFSSTSVLLAVLAGAVDTPFSDRRVLDGAAATATAYDPGIHQFAPSGGGLPVAGVLGGKHSRDVQPSYDFTSSAIDPGGAASKVGLSLVFRDGFEANLCPDPLPTPGPYLQLSCNRADGIVVTTCTNAEWEDLNQEIADGCEAPRQMRPFVPGNAFGNAAATAYADRLSGSFWLTGYPGDREPGDWWEVNSFLVPVQPSCGSTSFACPGGTAQNPPPNLRADFSTQPGDLPRRVVTNVQNASRFDITYRFRLATTEPIPVSISGADCQLTIDTTQGASQDLRVDFQVNFSGFGWQQTASLANLTVTQFESADWTLGGAFLCQIGASQVGGQILAGVQDTLADYFARRVNATCGAVDPYWWQACRTIVEQPPDPPTLPDPAPSCPQSPPPAGPYMTTSCHPTTGTLVKTCDSNWLDTNGLIEDGCERHVGGLVPMQLDGNSDQALADRISGSFFLGGYPGGTGTGTYFQAANPQRQPLPACGNSSFGCFGSEPQAPMPGLELDFALQGGDDPRTIGAYDAGQSAIFAGFRARLTTSGGVAFSHQGVACEVAIDSRRGPLDEILLVVAGVGSGTGPLDILGLVDTPEPATLQQFDDDDMVIGPHLWCSYWASGRKPEIRQWIRDNLVAWAARRGICGAPSPYFWQGCP